MRTPGTPFMIYLEPHEIAVRFADESSDYDDDEREAQELRASLREDAYRDSEEYMKYLPANERDAIELWRSGVNQRVIGTFFDVSQAAISYRIHRGAQRLRFLHESKYTSFDAETMERDLIEIFAARPLVIERMPWSQVAPNFKTARARRDALDLACARIAVAMWRTTCQSVVAAELGLTQGMVRQRFVARVPRCLRESPHPKAPRYLRFFEQLIAAGAILHEQIDHRLKKGPGSAQRNSAG